MSDDILEKRNASFFGFETIDPATGKKRRDPAVVRGNGNLTLSETELRFQRYAPPVDIRVPLDLVEGTRLARSHNGKSFGFLPVLQIAFRTATDTQVLGVCVGRQHEAEPWIAAIERARGNGRAESTG